MITVSAANLLDALTSVRRIIDEKGISAILQSALFHVIPGKLTITGTSQALGIRATVECTSSITDSGSFLISPSTLADAVKASKGSEVTIERDDRKATVRCGKAKYNINILDAADYPDIPKDLGVTSATVKIGSAALLDVIGRVEPLMGRDDTGPHTVVSGLLIERSDDGVRFVGTNGAALAYADAAADVDGTIPRAVISPAAVDVIRKEIGKVDEPVTVVVGSTAMTVELSGTMMFARMKQSEFPEYRLVLAPPSGIAVTVDRQEFIAGMKAILPLGYGKDSGLVFNFNPESIVVSARQVDVGDAQIEVPAKFNGDAKNQGFNAVILLAALGAIKADTVSIDIGKGALDLAIVKGEEGEGYWVVMPYRLNS